MKDYSFWDKSWSKMLNRRRNLLFQESFGRRSPGWRAYYSLATLIGLAFSLLGCFTPVQAETIVGESLCGNGSAPDYGFSYDLLQPHWTVGWENYASEQAVNRVDRVFDRLNEEAIAQTMILILPQDQVGIRTNCAVHFLRYMQLGLPTGNRKDNGFVFLIVVEPDRIDVHYAVGLGLPALTAQELTPINRAAENTYQSTHSMDEALVTLADEFNTVARNNYEPEPASALTPAPVDQPAGPVATLALCGQLCLGIFVFLFLLWLFSQMGGGGNRFYPPGPGSWGGGSWGGGFGGFGSRGFPSNRGGSSPGPRMRGGSGSGRSGRTN